LNFHGRVKLPSVKNFQLISPSHSPDDIFIQFGKVDDDTFHLDFRRPLSAFQAFCMSIAQFDY